MEQWYRLSSTMKVALLLLVVLVAVAQARRHQQAAGWQQSAEDSSESSDWRTPSSVDRQQPQDDSSDWTEAQEPEHRVICPRTCRLSYDPVCVRDERNIYRWFKNLCEMQQCRCRTKSNYVIVPIDMCRGSPKGCPDVWQPRSRSQPEEQSVEADSSASE